MRQFMVIDTSVGPEQKVGDVGGLSHGVFQGTPTHDDHRFRQMVVSGCTFSEPELIAWANAMTEPMTRCETDPADPADSVEDVMGILEPRGWVVLEFLTR